MDATQEGTVGAARSLPEAVAAGPLVLDGGMSNQLEADGHDLSDALWSARLLAEAPEAVAEAHLAYYLAGADVAISAGYQATYQGFARRGIGADATSALLVRSVELTRDAARRAGAGRPLWVAASVGPYGAMLADGSEYRGRYGLSVAELERFHRPRLEVLAAARPDAFALETVPDADEARALLRAVRGLGVPAWLSYSVSRGLTRAGQPLDEAFRLAAECDDVFAVGINCCTPADADAAVRLAARVTGKPVVVYPNSGETWDPVARGWTGADAFDGARAARWAEYGARLVGGCCRVGPERIADVAAQLRA
ncbi:homocysteine S-methyltransferase [Streptomyces sp. YIM 130001]|uniref:homocysteine S-methyltransferase n=1 Tax=Streptomyces sp. YIM 130001 TaxID=2259644 RepID=UPI000E655466|nr:homocysteine S-methyltransferase [Streptomyces sp. YIM 130001]